MGARRGTSFSKESQTHSFLVPPCPSPALHTVKFLAQKLTKGTGLTPSLCCLLSPAYWENRGRTGQELSQCVYCAHPLPTLRQGPGLRMAPEQGYDGMTLSEMSTHKEKMLKCVLPLKLHGFCVQRLRGSRMWMGCLSWVLLEENLGSLHP